jgi:hypothetical protein
MDKIQITTKKYDARMQIFGLSPNNTIKLLTIGSTTNYPINWSPNCTTRLVRKKPYEELTLILCISLGLDDVNLDRVR